MKLYMKFKAISEPVIAGVYIALLNLPAKYKTDKKDAKNIFSNLQI